MTAEPVHRTSAGWNGYAFIVIILLALSGCQSTGQSDASPRPADVYSGYFIWDSERSQGDAALQCIRLTFESSETLSDGRLRLTGTSRYITGPNDDIDYVQAELIYTPATGAFELWERNATNENFIENGKFVGSFRQGTLFLDGFWIGENDPESGRLTLRQGTDAPCTLAMDA